MSETNEPERPLADTSKLRIVARKQQAARWFALACLYEWADGTARRAVQIDYASLIVGFEHRGAWRSTLMYLVDAGWVVEQYETLVLTHQGVAAVEHVLRCGQLLPHFPADAIEPMAPIASEDEDEGCHDPA